MANRLTGAVYSTTSLFVNCKTRQLLIALKMLIYPSHSCGNAIGGLHLHFATGSSCSHWVFCSRATSCVSPPLFRGGGQLFVVGETLGSEQSHKRNYVQKTARESIRRASLQVTALFQDLCGYSTEILEDGCYSKNPGVPVTAASDAGGCTDTLPSAADNPRNSNVPSQRAQRPTASGLPILICSKPQTAFPLMNTASQMRVPNSSARKAYTMAQYKNMTANEVNLPLQFVPRTEET